MRGIGTDIAIVSCMVFLAQFILSSLMGSIVASSGYIFFTPLFEFITRIIAGSTVAVIVCAAVLSFCGAVSANFVSYLDL